MKLLIIEDEQQLQKSIVDYLEKDGFKCEVASDFNTGLDKIELYEYDCVIVDIGLPKGSGLDLVKSLKEMKSNSGIIIVSAIGDIETKLKGLNLGSDDYLTKPFHLSELNARIKSVIRRRKFEGQNLITLNEIKVFPDEHKVLVNEDELKLTKLEYKLLLYFISNRNRVITKTSLAEHLWGDYMDDADSYDFIYSHIKNLRKKLLEKGCEDYLKTIYGIGYNFKVS